MGLVEVGIQVSIEVAGITKANEVSRELCRANVDVVTHIQRDGRLTVHADDGILAAHADADPNPLPVDRPPRMVRRYGHEQDIVQIRRQDRSARGRA
jgi:hypothetical protein